MFTLYYCTLGRDLKPCKDPDEIFKAIKQGKILGWLFNLSHFRSPKLSEIMLQLSVSKFRRWKYTQPTDFTTWESFESWWKRMDPTTWSCCAGEQKNTGNDFFMYKIFNYVSLFFFFLDANPLLCIWVAASLPGAAQCRTLKGETPLFLAVVHGIRENATFLLHNGCSPDIQNDEQDSPLVAGTQLPL